MEQKRRLCQPCEIQALSRCRFLTDSDSLFERRGVTVDPSRTSPKYLSDAEIELESMRINAKNNKGCPYANGGAQPLRLVIG